MTNIKDEKAFVIASGSLSQQLDPIIHNLPQVDAISIFCGKKSRYEQWAKEWIKIKCIHTDIKLICQAVQPRFHRCGLCSSE